jgi:hypothetical protein
MRALVAEVLLAYKCLLVSIYIAHYANQMLSLRSA